MDEQQRLQWAQAQLAAQRLAETRRLMALFEAADTLYMQGKLPARVMDRLHTAACAAIIKAMR